MPNAKLYTVQTSRGTVYAVHNLATNMIWTEQNEYAARQSATERRVSIIEERTLTHVELLRLMGHEPPAPKPPAPATNDRPAAMSIEPLPDVRPNAVPATPLASSGIAARYHWDDDPIGSDDDTVIIPRAKSPQVKSVFCSEGKVGEPIPNPDKSEKGTTPDGYFVKHLPKAD